MASRKFGDPGTWNSVHNRSSSSWYEGRGGPSKLTSLGSSGRLINLVSRVSSRVSLMGWMIHPFRCTWIVMGTISSVSSTKKVSKKKKVSPTRVKRRKILLEVVGSFEHREVAEILDKSGKVKDTVPVSGTHRAAIDVKLPSGLTIRLTVDPWVLDEIFDLSDR